MTKLSIPASVRDYMHRRAIRTTVDHLLESGSEELPEGMDDWDEVRSYHKAVLSGYQVRAEHAIFLMDLWEAVWASTLRNSQHIGRALLPDEQVDVAGLGPMSPDALWADALCFQRVFKSKKDNLLIYTGVSYWHDAGVCLTFSVCDSDLEILSNEKFVLSEDWTNEPDEDGYFRTKDKICIPSANEVFDISSLREMASVAIAVLG